MTEPTPFLPLHLRLADRPVLVVGAGAVGRRRVALLKDASARIRWVSPELIAADHPGVEVIAAPFEPAHCDGMVLVLACAPPAVNAEVAAAAAARGAWLGRADEPRAGDVIVPALIRRGGAVLSLATGVPAATAALAEALAERLPAGLGHFVEVATRARARWTGRLDRAARLRRLVSGPLAAVLECAAAPDPEDVERWLAAEE